MRRLFRHATLLLSLWLVTGLIGCAGGPQFETLSVQVTPDTPIEASDDAVLRVSLDDTSENEPSTVAESRMERPGNSPYTATLRYDANAIDSDRNYVVRAELRQGGRLTHAEDEPVPVFAGESETADPIIELVPLPRQSAAGE
ncbi:YbaY family lipoprotein [Aidingimonas lacisalsi]|uniref:YbaY family lipoprotein n=1 Tax=Aidingimonas lacisalsi TaxID=2604086 RepID=UPI001375AB8F|nr:YbaY family lipoprotein [Aidingimonas lacisalsi]